MTDNQCFERQMLTYFKDTQAPDFPTFSSFAGNIGVTTAELYQMRAREAGFAAAWEECREIQKSALIQGGLSRRYDPSFSKYLLAEMFGFDEETGRDTLTVTVEVVE